MHLVKYSLQWLLWSPSSLTCIDILRIPASDGHWSLKIRFIFSSFTQKILLILHHEHLQRGHSCFCFSYQSINVVVGFALQILSGRYWFGAECVVCADCDAAVWTEQVMQWALQSPGVLWVHGWDTPERVSQMRTSFLASAEVDQGVCGCSTSVLTHTHSSWHTQLPSCPTMCCIYLPWCILYCKGCLTGSAWLILLKQVPKWM